MEENKRTMMARADATRPAQAQDALPPQGFTSLPRLYRLQHTPEYFYTGHLKDGTQVFMAPNYPVLLAVLFDGQGSYLKHIAQEMSQETQSHMREWISSKGQKWEGYAKQWDELNRWATELGFMEGVITIQKFCLPEHELRIRELPCIWQETTDLGEPDAETEEMIQSWRETNDYVLVWGSEFDIDSLGKVIST